MKQDKVILITGADKNLSKYPVPKLHLSRYAKLHGFDFEYYDFSLSKLNPKLQKAIAINNLKNYYEYVIWVDYDVMVLNFDVNIMDYINRKVDINVCAHKYRAPTLLGLFKTGFKNLIIENSGVIVYNTKSKDFGFDFLGLTAHYTLIKSMWKDNSALLELIGKFDLLKKIDSNLRYEQDLGIGCSYSLMANKFNFIPNVSKGDIKEAVFIHFAGQKENRDRFLQ